MPRKETVQSAVKASLTFAPVTRESWPDFERLFMSPGAPKYCWCMAWRGTNAERKEWSGAPDKAPARGELSPSNVLRRAAMKRRVDHGTPVGLIAYDADEPVGWVSVAPRPTFRPLGGPDDHAEAPEAVWSIVCFYLKRRYRGTGYGRDLLNAAVAHARAEGATVIEAYPVRPDSPSYRFMGLVANYERAGFVAVGTAGSRRTVMRRAVDRTG